MFNSAKGPEDGYLNFDFQPETIRPGQTPVPRGLIRSSLISFVVYLFISSQEIWAFFEIIVAKKCTRSPSGPASTLCDI